MIYFALVMASFFSFLAATLRALIFLIISNFELASGSSYLGILLLFNLGR